MRSFENDKPGNHRVIIKIFFSFFKKKFANHSNAIICHKKIFLKKFINLKI